MPIFSYFLVVGAALLGLLFVASAFVGNSEPVRFVTTDTLPLSGVKANNATISGAALVATAPETPSRIRATEKK